MAGPALSRYLASVPRAVRLTRKGVWCRWSALMVKDVAATPHVRDFVALVGREMSRRVSDVKFKI